MLQNYKPVTQFVNLMSIPSANAENITANLVIILKDDLNLQNWTQNVLPLVSIAYL